MKNAHDPIEAFFEGLCSGPVRTVLGLTTILAILFSYHGFRNIENEDGINLFELVCSLLFMVFAWGNWGFWFFVGLMACIAMWGGLYAFVCTDHIKASFFVMVTGALVYFLPLTSRGGWLPLGVGYLMLVVIYWIVPRMLCKAKAG